MFGARGRARHPREKRHRLSRLQCGDARLETLERLKNNYEERAYLQLKALVNPGKP